MNEKPKSIWKKSWTGLGAVFILVVSAAVAVFLVAFIYALTNWERPVADTLTTAALIGFVLAACCLFAGCFVLSLRWLFWTHWRRGLFGLACFATLIALAYAEEDWRGWHAWNQFKHEWEAKGEKFDWQSVVPPPVPDDQNFAMAPIWVESIKAMLGPERARQWKYPSDGRTNYSDWMPIIWHNNDGSDSQPNGDWTKGTITDLKQWQIYYRSPAATNQKSPTVTNDFPITPQPQTPAEDVLLALSKFGPAIEELRQASRLPYSRFPLGYDSENPSIILLPHLSLLKRSALVLELRSIAELQNGQSEKALDDVKLMLRLTDAVRTEPFLISQLVRIAMLQITLQPIYEGLAEHKWSDAQLAELDAELAKLDFLADYGFSMRGEMIFGISETEYLHRSRNFQALDYSENGSHDNSASHLGFRLAPASFFYQNELTIAQMHERWTLPMVDPEKRVVSPELVKRNNDAASKVLNHPSPCNILARMIFPAFSKSVTKYVRAQSSVDLARVAIALERYRLAHGGYPDSLDALAPQFMKKVPHDVIGGGPLHYRRTSDGQFVLYSVGWNERDDGGVVVLQKGSTPAVDINQGDWVWRYPQKE